jgi:hypothetical protein
LIAPGGAGPARPTEAAPLRRGAGRPFRPRVPDTLRALYHRYCETEARALVDLLPTEGRRALLRAGRREGEPLSVDVLIEAARRLLPLPPYEVWVSDYLANRAAYLTRMGIPAVPDRPRPVTVDVRPVGNGWWASLDLRHDEGGWVGYVAFHPDPGADPGGTMGIGVPGASATGVIRTADVFRGPDPEALRARFRGFGQHAMEGFFRSATAGVVQTVL